METERDSTRQAGELAALRRMLIVSEGCFSLSFVVCNDRTLRNELIAGLRNEFPGLVLVEMPPNTADVYRTVCDPWSGESPRGVFVVDIEASLPSQTDSYPTLRALNSSRELWERLACPVVFWLAEYAAALVARHAPDFWRYRSHQFEFVSDRAGAGEAIAEPFAGFSMVDALPYEEKRFRIAELEERLQQAGSPPSPELLPHAIDWLYELAHLYGHASKFNRARELLDVAVSCTESAYGRDDPRTATALSNLAQLLGDTNRMAEAEPLMRRALQIDERSFGQEHPEVATDLNNLAQLLQDTNRMAEAELLMRRALQIDEKSLGKNHSDVARDLNNLAMLLKDTNRVAEAEPFQRRALQIDEQNFGKVHPEVARDLNNLAQLLQATNRLAEAEPLFRRALQIDEQSFGNEHPNVATDLNNLAQLLQATNRMAEAEPLFRRALQIDEQRFGNEHPSVATDLNNLAGWLTATNRIVEAEPLMRRALEIYLKFTAATGHPHSFMAKVIKNYAALIAETGLDESQVRDRLNALCGPYGISYGG